MGIMDLFKRHPRLEPVKTTSDSAKELDERQHAVARRLHVLEYETSEAVQVMRARAEDERRHKIRRKEDQ